MTGVRYAALATVAVRVPLLPAARARLPAGSERDVRAAILSDPLAHAAVVAASPSLGPAMRRSVCSPHAVSATPAHRPIGIGRAAIRIR